jgi:predicted dehydrogenase
MMPINRRAFLGTAALSVAAAPHLLRGAAEDRKIQLGLIGCGGYGRNNLRAAFRVGGVEMAALCDVDSEHLAATAGEVETLQGKRPQTFKHHEQLLSTPGLSAVIIASPPQWHALHFIAACEKGFDVYCEKPLAYDIREGRAMVEAAQKSGRVVQIGFQRRQATAIQQARQYLQDGKAGRIVCVDAQIHYTAGTKDATPQDPPPSLDWDLWCGPAPRIPYSPQVGHVNWRLEKTTGHGHLVDWGIHLIDATRWILGESTPRTVSASGGICFLKDKITTPDVLTAHFEFEKCPVTWRHRIWGAEEFSPEVSNGILFYGEKETVFVTDNKWIVIPRGKGKDRTVNEVKSDAGTAQMAEFLKAVRTREQPGCTPEEAHRSTTTVKLAMIAYDTGAKIAWDGDKEMIAGNEAAGRMLKREYRSPWKHPFPA